MIDTIKTYTEIVKDNIDYQSLVDKNPHEKTTVNEIIDLIVETITSSKETIRVNGEDKPTRNIKSRFLKLDETHIEYVLFALTRNTSQIRNIKAYLLTTLYNASMTISSYYTTEGPSNRYGEYQ